MEGCDPLETWAVVLTVMEVRAAQQSKDEQVKCVIGDSLG
jgi:hypothetical protein